MCPRGTRCCTLLRDRSGDGSGAMSSDWCPRTALMIVSVCGSRHGRRSHRSRRVLSRCARLCRSASRSCDLQGVVFWKRRRAQDTSLVPHATRAGRPTWCTKRGVIGSNGGINRASWAVAGHVARAGTGNSTSAETWASRKSILVTHYALDLITTDFGLTPSISHWLTNLQGLSSRNQALAIRRHNFPRG